MIARYQAIEQILSHLQGDDLLVSTTGMISRELFTLDDRPGNFYMIGSMGLASAMGLGLAVQAPHKRIFVLEGDGSAMMSLGTLPLIAPEAPPNLVHIILDNQIGFTTLPIHGRSTRYASDLAKGFSFPIIHVNADDPEACLAAVRLAMAYRAEYHDDVIIDLVGYRRYGHNEGDEPGYTQPLMTEAITLPQIACAITTTTAAASAASERRISVLANIAMQLPE